MRQRCSRAGGALVAFLIALPAVLTADPPNNVRLRCPQRSYLLRKALENAARRLSQPECGRVLSEFQDAGGRSLQANLDTLGLPASDYVLKSIFFYDAEEEGKCRYSVVAAVTQPGSRVVQICPRFDLRSQRPKWTEALLIHEALHTLGLGENPPSSREITHRVLQYCGGPITAASAHRP
jgi:hypothetical protein